MKRVLVVIVSLLVPVLLAVMTLAWWYLGAEKMEPPELAGTMEYGSVEHDGLTRTWRAYIPSLETGPAPLVLILHGSRGDGQRMLEGTRYGFNLLAEREGFIPVYPDGFEKHWNDCRASAGYSANVRNIDDVGFFRAMVREIAARHNIDQSRIYVAGMSNGGHMAYRVGFEAPELTAGIAAIAASLPVEDNLDCERSGEPVATLVMNGTEDPINPYDGGLVEIRNDSSRGRVLSSRDTARYWAHLAGYGGEGQQLAWPKTSPDATSIESTRWSAPGKPPVTLITVVSGGHTIPHPLLSVPRILGRTSHELDASGVIWSFFSGREYAPEELVNVDTGQ
jgi:polyhydroxybutyrate depolymerase